VDNIMAFINSLWWRVVLLNSDILTYTNEHVVARYAKTYNKSLNYSRDVFEQLIKWLYLANACHEKNIPAIVTPDILEIDNMWHTFLLFTRDYASFCNKYFNKFIHHEPTIDDSLLPNKEERRASLKIQLELLGEAFGVATLIAWHKEKKYASKEDVFE
jgi:hypothetical protein